MNHVLQNLDEPTLESAMNANHAAFWMTLSHYASHITGHHADAKLAWLSSPIEFAYPYNLVLPLALPPAEQSAAVAKSIQRAKNQQVSTEWWLSPSAMESGLDQQLMAQGYAYIGGPVAMAVDLANLNQDIPRPENFEILRVENEARLNDWVSTFVEGWPGPDIWRPMFMEAYGGYGFGAGLDMRHYLGYLDGRPATASTLYLGEGVAGIYAVATRAEYRGRGLGAWITLRPLLEARQQGYRVGILQASNMGHPVYRRIGFEDIFEYRIYQWPAP